MNECRTRWGMRHMNLQITTKNHVINGEKTCILCNNDFEYAAIISGEKNVKELSSIYKGKVITDQVVILKKSLANNGTLQIVDVELTAKCPQCHSNHRINSFLTLN
jgi:hypothetical protein